MDPQLPPPDPDEGEGVMLPGLELAEPAVFFPLGPPDDEAVRFAETILRCRPGALIVFDAR